MKSLFKIFILLFVLVDAFAILVWWVHPEGAKKMGLSGKLPIDLPFDPVKIASQIPFPQSGGGQPSFLKGDGGDPEQNEEPAPVPSAAPVETAASPAPEPQPARANFRPGKCATPEECSAYCTDTSHRKECQDYCKQKKNRAECLDWDRISLGEEAAKKPRPKPVRRKRAPKKTLLGEDNFGEL